MMMNITISPILCVNDEHANYSNKHSLFVFFSGRIAQPTLSTSDLVYTVHAEQ